MKHALAALLLFFSSPLYAADFTGRVVRVSDGDTLVVVKEDKRQEKLRLNGIDSPESGQDFGQASKQALINLAAGKDVVVTPHSTDRYGRTVADVALPNGVSLNRQMVADGYAWWFRKYAPRDAELERLEATAKAAKKGLWANANPIAPWDWRDGIGVTGFVGNAKSRLYHRPHCPAAQKIAAKNRVAFASEAEAVKAGFTVGKDCD